MGCYLLKVRGAPAIGVAAALGIYLLANRIETEDFEDFYQKFTEYKEYLDSSRPTAVNLSWALKRMDAVAVKAGREEHKTVAKVKEILHDEALQIRAEDVEVCRKIGELGLELVKPGDGILTHCNAGQLATVKYGTATAPIYLGQERGYNFHVFADETRPLLQGARLTAFELHSAGVDVTLICDNMSASVMSKGWVQAVFVGCDRVAANGDTANKIGTSVVAAVAKQYGVPVYICAPTSTIDMATATGADICIEQRKAEEVTEMWYKERMAPEGIKVYNPAFDVTDHEPDFIHVGGGHHGFFRVFAFHDGNHAAHVVHAHGVHQRGHFLDDEIADFVFKPRSARSHANLTKQFQIHNAVNVMVFMKVG